MGGLHFTDSATASGTPLSICQKQNITGETRTNVLIYSPLCDVLLLLLESEEKGLMGRGDRGRSRFDKCLCSQAFRSASGSVWRSALSGEQGSAGVS